MPVDNAIRVVGKERPSLGDCPARIPPGMAFDREVGAACVNSLVSPDP
jgi:hypothetical protein